MILGIQGTRSFDKYSSIFLHGMWRALSLRKPDDYEFIIYSAGPANINSMALEYVNVSDFKRYGVKARVHKVSPSWLKSNLSQLDMFLYFCLPKENQSELCRAADRKNIDVEVYSY